MSDYIVLGSGCRRTRRKSNLKHYTPIQLPYPESEIIFYPFQYTCMHIPHSRWRWILVPKQQQEYAAPSIPSSHPSPAHRDDHSTPPVHRRCQHSDRPCLIRCVPDHVICIPDTLRTFSIARLCILIHAVVLFITLVVLNVGEELVNIFVLFFMFGILHT